MSEDKKFEMMKTQIMQKTERLLLNIHIRN